MPRTPQNQKCLRDQRAPEDVGLLLWCLKNTTHRNPSGTDRKAKKPIIMPMVPKNYTFIREHIKKVPLKTPPRVTCGELRITESKDPGSCRWGQGQGKCR